LNCQNWTISQKSPSETKNIDLPPQQVVQNAVTNQCKSIAYTYAEPITFYEYVYDTSIVAREQGIKNVFISNGYINADPLKKLCKVIDAANINLKSFSDDIYLRLNAGKLEPILNTLKTMKDEGVWLEITNLIVPSWTDDMDMIKRMSDWLVLNGFADVPIHFSRFHPMYKLTQLPATPVNILVKARDIAIKAGCNYVYVGNAPGLNTENTFCPRCKSIVVERRGFKIIHNTLDKGKCGICKSNVPGVWD
jgi:pyruvate formate lyase activating enzyme